MPQSSGTYDSQKALITATGRTRVLNISAATVIKATPGRIVKVQVLVAGTTVGTINDLAVLTGAALANQVGVIPNTVGPFDISMPCSTGILIVPGTGQTVAVSYN